MFEQAILSDRRAVSPWAVTLSATGQTAVVGSVMLFTLIRTEILPVSSNRPEILLAPMGGQRRPARALTARPGQAPTPRPGALIFRQPGRMASATAILDDTAPQIQESSESGGGGFPAGVQNACIGCIGSSLLLATAKPGSPRPVPLDTVVKPIVRITVGGRIQAAKLISQARPGYPPLARQARVSGTVRLEAVIAKDGTIQNLRAISGHPLLTPAALDAVRTWRYEPTLLNGDPVEVVTQIEVNFTLS
jgi:protein TonB